MAVSAVSLACQFRSSAALTS